MFKNYPSDSTRAAFASQFCAELYCTMANLKLSTGRRIIVHSHYEHRKIRHRTKLVYRMFSRNSLRYIHLILK
ncbi:unnamed protein product [Rotaria sordida]|uniref:Uncharacterized protein n=1 Tax=Rotaria sordida TaxID=392033 RepID=A0A815BSP0_9BILA|nr:unnamed protein product [Rotaria sordida]CAF3733383.1 unnamed protein product [Rotaria sordida]